MPRARLMAREGERESSWFAMNGTGRGFEIRALEIDPDFDGRSWVDFDGQRDCGNCTRARGRQRAIADGAVCPSGRRWMQNRWRRLSKSNRSDETIGRSAAGGLCRLKWPGRPLPCAMESARLEMKTRCRSGWSTMSIHDMGSRDP